VPEARSVTATSPLSGFAVARGPITLEERPFVGKVALRGEESTFLDAVAGVLGAVLPEEPNTTVKAGARTIFWLGPNEWLVHTLDGEEAALVVALRQALAGVHAAVVDVSDYYTVLRLAGAQARTVLGKGCPLDLHPRAFKPGDCAQSLIAKASVLLHLVDESPTLDIQVRWSFAEYLWLFLTEAALEFQKID